MLEQIKLLIKLQSLDKVMRELEVEKNEIPTRLADLSVREEKLNQDLSLVQSEALGLKQQRKSLEDDTEALRSRLRKTDSRLMGAKTQKEYRAASAELEDGKDILKLNDDKVVEIMERQEVLSKKQTQLSKEVEEISGQLTTQRQELTKRNQEVSSLLKTMTKEREQATSQVDQTILKEYDFIRSRRHGVALAGVSQATCLACRMQIPPQQFNELQRMDKIMYCPSCKRLIYWSDAETLNE